MNWRRKNMVSITVFWAHIRRLEGRGQKMEIYENFFLNNYLFILTIFFIDQFENMSDDEKEREANRLASLINDMAVQGVIKPMSMDPLTGKQTELNMHPGIIADSLKYASGLKKETEDSEAESD